MANHDSIDISGFALSYFDGVVDYIMSQVNTHIEDESLASATVAEFLIKKAYDISGHVYISDDELRAASTVYVERGKFTKEDFTSFIDTVLKIRKEELRGDK